MKPGYKQTEVGVIPEDWEVRRLDSLGAGSTPPIKAGPFGSSLTKDTYVPTGYKIYGQEQVIRGDYLYGDYFITLKKYRELESCAVRPGDVLLSLVGTVGKLLAVPDDAPPGIINPRLIRFSFDKGLVCPKFFTFLFESELVQSLLERRAQGGTMGVLNAGLLRPFPIQLPPLPEQRAIAAALSDVDALLGGLERLITKKRDLKQAAMQQLLTGQTRLPGFDGAWETVTMRKILIENATYGIVTAGKYVQNGIKMLRGGDITDGRINTDLPMVTHEKASEYGRTTLLKDDVVIALVGYPGASAKIPDSLIGANISRAVGLLRMNGKVLADFLVFILNSVYGRRMVLAPSAGSAQQVVNLAALNKLQFLVPPLPEQIAIAAVLSDMDAELVALEQRRTKTRALKQAMMQELLTGRTRLIARGDAENAE